MAYDESNDCEAAGFGHDWNVWDTEVCDECGFTRPEIQSCCGARHTAEEADAVHAEHAAANRRLAVAAAEQRARDARQAREYY